MHVNRFDTAAAEWDQKQRRVDLAAAIAAGIAALGAIAAPSAALADSATSATFQIGEGKLVLDGVAVDLPVTATCAPFNSEGPGVLGSISLTVSQNTGELVTTSFRQRQVLCDGTPQSLQIRLYVNNGSPAFIPDLALVSVRVTNNGNDAIEGDVEVPFS